MRSKEGSPRQATYKLVTEARERVEVPTSTLLPVVFKDETYKTGLIPYAVEAAKNERGVDTLMLQYKKSDGTEGAVDLSTVNGIDVVNHDEEQRIRFTYFNPKSGEPEENPREIVYKKLYYGIHPNHEKLGEFPDFYINGDDMQYQEGQRDRTFPLWRMGVYGDPLKASEYFMPDKPDSA